LRPVSCTPRTGHEVSLSSGSPPGSRTPAFRVRRIRAALPHVRIAIDGWHLVRLANQTVTEVRQRVTREVVVARPRRSADRFGGAYSPRACVYAVRAVGRRGPVAVLGG
jgi:Transposase